MRKYLKNLCIRSVRIILSITYNLVSDSIILHHMPENIRKALDEVNISRGGFANLQKAFDTADFRRVDWFKSYLSIAISLYP